MRYSSYKGARALLLSILAGALIYAGFVAGMNPKVVPAILRLGPADWAIILGLSLFNYTLRFARWHGYLHNIGTPVPIGRDLAVYLSGFAFTLTPGKAGEAVRSLYLRPCGVAYEQSLAVFFVERFLDVCAMVPLAALALLTFSDYKWGVAVAGFLVLCVPVLLRYRGLIAFMERRVEARPWGALHAMLVKITHILRITASLLTSTRLYGGLVIGVIAWGAEGLALYYIAHVLGLDIHASVAVGIYALSVVIGAISFIPGGLGSTEAAMILLLTGLGGNLNEAATATILCRLATLWFAVGIGIVAFLGLELRDWRLVKTRSMEV